MSDNDDRLLLNAMADDELDAATSLALERRLAAEPALAREYERIKAVKAAVGRAERPAVSDDFAARIAALAAPRAGAAPVAQRPARRVTWVDDWRAMAAALVVAAGLASGLTYALVAPGASPSAEDEIVGGHRRSLLASSAIDVASSDRHTVRPWLDAKLGVSPPTPDLSAKGFPLVGGRVEVVAGQPVPTLVYRRGPHLITVVAKPVASGLAAQPVASTDEGYNIVRWTSRGFSYWAVSDLDAPELGAFVDALRAAADPL
jgi:anti-sigma factor RsiW